MSEYKLSITLVYDHDGKPLTRREKLRLRMAVARQANLNLNPVIITPRSGVGAVYFAPTFEGDVADPRGRA